VAVVVISYLLSLIAVIWVAHDDQARPAQAIVVLGAAQYNGRPSPVFKARLDHAADLYRDRLAPLVVVTGGLAPGDRMSEATAGQRYLVAAGIPAESIAVQPVGRSTAASMRAVATYLHGVNRNRVLLVSDPFHLARLRLDAHHVGLIAWTSPTRTSPISKRPTLEFWHFAQEAAKLPAVLIEDVFQ
jgi:uncharacterized SAM-binding protein YcdF (DUF218 family)